MLTQVASALNQRVTAQLLSLTAAWRTFCQHYWVA